MRVNKALGILIDNDINAVLYRAPRLEEAVTNATDGFTFRICKKLARSRPPALLRKGIPHRDSGISSFG